MERLNAGAITKKGSCGALVSSRGSHCRGYSLVELMTVIVIMLLISAVGLPSITRSIRLYRLRGATVGVANIIQTARYEAIRTNRNTPAVSARFTTSNGRTIVWVDSNNNGAPDATEMQFMLPGDVQFISTSAVPSLTTMGYTSTQTPSGVITFDARGTVSYGTTPQIVYVLVLGYPSHSEWGFAAVSVTPMGKTQNWGAPAQGPWSKR